LNNPIVFLAGEGSKRERGLRPLSLRTSSRIRTGEEGVIKRGVSPSFSIFPLSNTEKTGQEK
jgi:hypothetical protein